MVTCSPWTIVTIENARLLRSSVYYGFCLYAHFFCVAYETLCSLPPLSTPLSPSPSSSSSPTPSPLSSSPSELSSPDLPSLLLQFCKQVVDGLACLARKSFVHRDIAARNILLDKDLNCKVRILEVNLICSKMFFMIMWSSNHSCYLCYPQFRFLILE